MSEFFDWWAGQMHDLMPARYRSTAGEADGWIVRAEDDGRLALLARARGRETVKARVAPDASGMTQLRSITSGRRALLLRLPAHVLLERDTTLPLAAEGDLARVLGYEMDRITPFRAEQLYWSFRLLRRDRARGALHVRLCMVTRLAADPLLELLRAAGLKPGALTLAGADGRVRHIDLAVARTRRRPLLVPALAGLCGVLALISVAGPIVDDLRRIEASRADIERLKPEVALVDALRRRIAAAAGGSDVFAAETARVGQVLQALAALTEILPDDTWLTTLTLHERVLTFTGQSARAARLIPALAADPALRNPAFVTPVTRADSNGADLFSIRAELKL